MTWQIAVAVAGVSLALAALIKYGFLYLIELRMAKLLDKTLGTVLTEPRYRAEFLAEFTERLASRVAYEEVVVDVQEPGTDKV